jgi:hypothetical protein
LLLAPSAHAVARLVSVASTTRAQKTTPGTFRSLHGRGHEPCQRHTQASELNVRVTN